MAHFRFRFLFIYFFCVASLGGPSTARPHLEFKRLCFVVVGKCMALRKPEHNPQIQDDTKEQRAIASWKVNAFRQQHRVPLSCSYLHRQLDPNMTARNNQLAHKDFGRDHAPSLSTVSITAQVFCLFSSQNCEMGKWILNHAYMTAIVHTLCSLSLEEQNPASNAMEQCFHKTGNSVRIHERSVSIFEGQKLVCSVHLSSQLTGLSYYLSRRTPPQKKPSCNTPMSLWCLFAVLPSILVLSNHSAAWVDLLI